VNAKVPVVIVSGFLGSGKTTLVRRMLEDAQARGLRMGVISNEFGELGIDAALLGAGEQRMIELAGGCVCCQLSDELVDTLHAMRERVDPDRIVIETSGVALPYETQLNLYRPGVREWVGDDACVVVVDAARVDEGGETLEQQVGGADLVLLNKVDLRPAAAVEAQLRAMNPGAPILPTVRCELPVEVLYPSGPRARHGAPGAHHHEGFVAHELAVPAGMSPGDALAWIEARRGLRTKGFVLTSEGPRVVQGVGARIELAEPEVAIDPALLGRVVVIDRTGARHSH
jgi:G3E family GTPase